MNKASRNIPVEVSGLDSRFECPICLLCLKDPVLTSCGHRFCGECIKSWITKKDGCCPVDKTKLESKDLFPDNFTRREIFNERTQCQVCDEELSLSEIDDHLANHSSAACNQCPFFDVGCNEDVAVGQMKQHLELQIHHHMQLLQTRIQASKVDTKCEEAKLWDAGKGPEQADSLVRVLYERVIVLEQRAHEQECQIQRWRRDAMAVDSKIYEMSLKHCFGEFVWRVEKFADVIQDLRTKRTYKFSPGFYTSPAGYKICARINIAPHDPDYLSLLVHLMQSDNDVALPWPFAGAISLAVVHPTVPDKAILDTMTADPGSEAFARPLRVINPKAFGFIKYVTISALLNDSDYLDEKGVLIIKILAQSKFSAP